MNKQTFRDEIIISISIVKVDQGKYYFHKYIANQIVSRIVRNIRVSLHYAQLTAY